MERRLTLYEVERTLNQAIMLIYLLSASLIWCGASSTATLHIERYEASVKMAQLVY